jgi:hypothetical protein
LPPDLTAKPLLLKNIPEVTRKIKVMAAYAGADKAGVTATETQQIGQFHPFIRYGYADVDADGPTLGIVFDPVDNPEEDTVYVMGLRTGIYF